MRRRSDSVAGPVLLFVALGLVVLVAVGITGVLVLGRIAQDQATDAAAQGADLAARVIEGRLQDGIVDLEPEATAVMHGAVTTAILFDPVVAVRLLDDDGTIVYSSDEPGSEIARSLTDAERGVLATGGTLVQVAEDPSELVVTTRVTTPDGTALLFQTDQQGGSVAADERDLLATFTPVLVVALAALALLLFPLAYVLARRVKQADRDRERLLQRALDSSDRERRRLAGDLHDGPVQDLAGLSMQLAAKAELTQDPAASEALASSADAVRESVRVLRSAIVEVYPPNLRQSGLGPALSDLTARLRAEGLEVVLRVEPPTFGPDIDELLYRACQEGLRNVIAHARASRVDVVARREGTLATLTVRDDGVGLDGALVDGDDHLGLRILGELVDDAGGSLSVRGDPSGGTVMRVEVPAR